MLVAQMALPPFAIAEKGGCKATLSGVEGRLQTLAARRQSPFARPEPILWSDSETSDERTVGRRSALIDYGRLVAALARLEGPGDGLNHPRR